MNEHGTCDACGHDGDLTDLNGKKLCPICFIFQVHGYIPVKPAGKSVNLNPSCSEVVFRLGGMTADTAIETLRSIGVDPDMFQFSDDASIDCVEIGIMNDRLSGDDREVKSMEAIEKHFGGEWEPDTGDLEFYTSWKISGMAKERSLPVEELKMVKLARKIINASKLPTLNPNCSEVVFKLPGMSKEDAMKTLRNVGIIEVTIPLKLLNGDENEDISWNVLVDKDNRLVPNMDSKYGCAMLAIDDVEGTVEIGGGINLEFSAFPTMKKIRDAFPGHEWEEVTGGDMSGEFKTWIENGMEYSKWQKKAMKDEVKKPGKYTRIARKKIIDPAFDGTGTSNSSTTNG